MSVVCNAHGFQISFQWLKTNILDRIQISGQRVLGYHSYSVSGDREAWETLNLYGQGDKRFTDYGAMSFQGRNVLGFANFQARVETGRYADPQAQEFSLEYIRGPYDVRLGDVQGSLLNSNRFASFRKSLKGASAGYSKGRFAIKGVFSEAKGSARTVSISGNNSAGPYYLQVGQLVRGSEDVEVDGVPMRLGDDYVINYELGSLTFINRIIAPTSTILVSFEAFGFNSDRGTVEGISTSYQMGKAGKIGVTAMRQQTGSGDALSQRIELLQGAGSPSTPYFLEFEPLLTRPITVRLDGVLQTEAIDYRFDTENPTIFYFLRFIPLTSTIEVVYTPAPTQTVVGDREVLGVDYTLPLGAGGQVTYAQATGKLKSTATPLEGTARGVDARYRIGDYALRGSWRNIPDGYVSVETRGFNRNEKAYDFGVRYQKKGLSWDVNHIDSDISVRTTNSSGGVSFSQQSITNSRFTLTDARRVGTPWNYEAAHQTATTALGNSRLSSARVSTSAMFGNLITHWGVESQFGRGPITNGKTTTLSDIALQSLRLSATYPSGKEWSFGAQTSVSHVKAGDEDGLGSDLSFTAGYTPNEKLNVSLGYSLSDSGALATLGGFQSGFGVGYNGNGFSGGISQGVFTTGVTDFRQLRAVAQYELTDWIGLTGSFYDTRYAGSVSSNTETKSMDIGVDVRFRSGTALIFNLAQSNTNFIGSPQRSEATTASFGVSGRSGHKFGYDVRLNYLLSGGTSTFKQDDFGVDFGATYILAPRHRLNALGRIGRTTGYLPQDDTSFELAYGYQLWRNLNLVGSYKFRDVVNKDGNPTGAYRANGFDIELRFGF